MPITMNSVTGRLTRVQAAPPYLAGKQFELQPQDLVVYQLVPSKLSQGLFKVPDR